jgi:hypothetical protein
MEQGKEVAAPLGSALSIAKRNRTITFLRIAARTLRNIGARPL